MPRRQKALKEVLTWCLTDGQKQSESLGYIPLPDSVVTKVKAALDNIKSGGDGSASDKSAEKSREK